MSKVLLHSKIVLVKIILNPKFIIKIENGIASKASGCVRSSFLWECAEIAKTNQIKSGLVYGINSTNGQPILKLSKEIPKAIRQLFRNVFHHRA